MNWYATDCNCRNDDTDSKTFGSVTPQSNQLIAGTNEVILKVPKTFAQMPLGFALDAGELEFCMSLEDTGPAAVHLRPISKYIRIHLKQNSFIQLRIYCVPYILLACRYNHVPYVA